MKEERSGFDIFCAVLFAISGLVEIIAGAVCDEPLFAIGGILWFILAKLYIGIPVIHIKQ